jgi:uncharacterized cofD-like protein
VVAVGGGHGLANALEALQRLDVEPTAVVTVADDGGSSGRLRRDLGIIPPGDLRMALLTLARDRGLADVLGHRFVRGELEGHALGNLLLVALAERADGDFVAALDAAAGLLDCAGRVLPATTTPVQLKARVHGQEVDGQVRVAQAEGPIECVWIEPGRPAGCREAVAAIEAAELVLLGPGSLFTSVVAALLVPTIGEAVVASRAPVVAILNLSTQPGETTGFTCDAHIDALVAHLPELQLDAVVVHEGPPGIGEGEPIVPDLQHAAVSEVVRADLLRRDPDGAPGWGHDPDRLAAALRPILERALGTRPLPAPPA